MAAIMVSFTSCIPDKGVYMDEQGTIYEVLDPHNLDQIKNDLVLKTYYSSSGFKMREVVGIYTGFMPKDTFVASTDSPKNAYSFTYKRVKRIYPK